MTVLEFGKKDFNINYAIFGLIGLVSITAVFGIYSYNSMINLRHETANNKELITQAQIKNAELKDELYRILDNAGGEEWLRDNGLVFDKDPQYSVPSQLSAH